MSDRKHNLVLLAKLPSSTFDITQASKVLNLSISDTSKKLSRWCKQGYLSRIRRGLYTVVPNNQEASDYLFEDTFHLAPKLFGPCYIGGWTACEFWDFTDQVFNSVCVYTTKPIKLKSVEYHFTKFRLTRIKDEHKFGTKTIWSSNSKVEISDPHKTIVDILKNPSNGGGINHVIDCVNQYFMSDHYSIDQITKYCLQMRNGAIFKRLGFIAERLLGDDNYISKFASNHLTQGVSRLDPNNTSCKMVTKWKLWVPRSLI